MRYAHRMPFGAELLDDGRVAFRLWAPAATRVDLALEGHAARLPMEKRADGWFSLATPLAGPGSRYQFCIDDKSCVPDPASRWQDGDVHGKSVVIDPRAFDWQDRDWHGRPWEEVVCYELHVGTVTPEGSFAALQSRLDHFVSLGVTALELMPVADFPGQRNWGYDGVLPFAPDSRYGHPDDLKALIQAAHTKGLMVFLDVVYNHFGPEGNYLHTYAPDFFTERHHTPWGAAINFDGARSRTVRDFFIHNALYWLQEYRFDGLRLDAVHAILDDSVPDVLTELADAVREGPGRERQIHLVLENDDNAARYLARAIGCEPRAYNAQWNDDAHHAFHVLLTGEASGYYMDYRAPLAALGRCLTEGYAYQGEPSPYRDNQPRGEPSAWLPLTAFVNFLQNHDQIGNRAFGERITVLAPAPAVRAATIVLLLAPSPPLVFMGQEWGTRQPFPFFCDFGPDLAQKVTEGRRKEFARFEQFRDEAARSRIPDPNSPQTFESARLDWSEIERAPHADWLTLHRELLALRQRAIVPRLCGTPPGRARYQILGPGTLSVQWVLGDASLLTLIANLAEEPVTGLQPPTGNLLFANPEISSLASGILPGWSAAWFISE